MKNRVRKISLEKTIWKNRVKKRTNKRLTIGMLIFLITGFFLFYFYNSIALQKQFHLMGNVISEFSGEPTPPTVAQVNS